MNSFAKRSISVYIRYFAGMEHSQFLRVLSPLERREMMDFYLEAKTGKCFVTGEILPVNILYIFHEIQSYIDNYNTGCGLKNLSLRYE